MRIIAFFLVTLFTVSASAKVSCSKIKSMMAYSGYELFLELENGHKASTGTSENFQRVPVTMHTLLQAAFITSKEVCIETIDHDGNNLVYVSLKN